MIILMWVQHFSKVNWVYTKQMDDVNARNVFLSVVCSHLFLSLSIRLFHNCLCLSLSLSFFHYDNLFSRPDTLVSDVTQLYMYNWYSFFCVICLYNRDGAPRRDHPSSHQLPPTLRWPLGTIDTNPRIQCCLLDHFKVCLFVVLRI